MDEYCTTYATWNDDDGSASGTAEQQHQLKGLVVDAIELSYSVLLRNGKYKRLLRDVTIHVESGSLCALMGASGAGKSTLLDLLADRKRSGVASGYILMDGQPRTPWFNRSSAYVLQNDLHIATLTVIETVRFAARVRMPEGTSEAQREARVQLLLSLMTLSHVSNSRVGDSMNRGISGGEAKRLSIAVEMVSLPGLIFLDEPTSGLDAAIALDVMTAVKRLSAQCRTCISTIHQPSPQVYGLFDMVILLSAGRVLYAGAASKAVEYFCRPELGFIFTEGTNPAEFIIDICSGAIVDPGGEPGVNIETGSERAVLLSPVQLASFFEQQRQRRGELSFSPHPPDTLKLPVYENCYATGSRTQFNMLLHRSWIALWRDTPNLQADIGKNLFIGTLVGVIFYGAADLHSPLFTDGTVPTAQQETMSALLFFGMMYGLVSNLQVVPQLCLNDQIYRRELASYAYSTAPYWAVQCIVGVPLLSLSLLCFGLLAYFLCQFPLNAGYFFFFLLMLGISTLASYYWAIALAAITGSALLTFVLHPLSFLFFMMFSGFPIVINDVPPLWRWATSFCFTRWVYEALMINEYDRFGSSDDDRFGGGGGQQVLQNYGFDHFNKYDSIGIVLLNVAVILAVAYAGMRPGACKLRWTVAHPENSKIKGSNKSRVNHNSAGITGVTTAGSDIYTPLSYGAPGSSGTQSDRISLSSRMESLINWTTSGLESMQETLLHIFIPGDGHLQVNDDDDGESKDTAATDNYGTAPSRDHSIAVAVCTPALPPPVANVLAATAATEHAGYGGGGVERAVGDSRIVFRNLSYSCAVTATSTGVWWNTTARKERANTTSTTITTTSTGSAPALASQEQKRSLLLLSGITGYALPGEMCALMGSSGAGKSTLLDVLAGRKTVGETRGEILLGGRPCTPAMMRRSAAYVLQDNVHIGELTVRETVHFAAQLRMSEGISPESRDLRVDAVLRMLRLTDVAHCIVGNDFLRGISGGQLKRLSIAVEIINLPSVLFLDEPTTGLDSHIALEVMTCVRALTNENRTVLCTIHQPSAATYALFDTLLLLGTGKVIYFGPASSITNYFTTSSFRFEYIRGTNPADFLVAVAGGFATATASAGSAGSAPASPVSSAELAEYYRQSVVGRANATAVDRMMMTREREKAGEEKPAGAEATQQFNYSNERERDNNNDGCTSSYNQVVTLCTRKGLKTWRFLLPEAAQMLIHIVCALFFGSVYYQLSTGFETPDYTNRLALLFFCASYQIMTHQKTVPLMFTDRLLYYRERGAGASSAFPFWVSASYLQLLISFVDTLVFAGIVHSMTGLAGSFSYFWGVLYLTSITGAQMALFVAAASPSPMAAISLYLVCLFWVIAFSGFLVFLPEFAYWLRCWAPDLSYLRWGFQGLVLNELKDNSALPLGPIYIDSLGFGNYNQEHCVSLIPIFAIAMSILSCTALHFLNFERR